LVSAFTILCRFHLQKAYATLDIAGNLPLQSAGQSIPLTTVYAELQLEQVAHVITELEKILLVEAV